MINQRIVARQQGTPIFKPQGIGFRQNMEQKVLIMLACSATVNGWRSARKFAWIECHCFSDLLPIVRNSLHQ
jgi:hypothetical protein